MGQSSLTRREFIRVGTGAMAATTAAKVTIIEPNPGLARSRAVAPSDTVRFASIGTGVRGCELLEASLRVPGVECVAVCDLYDSRHDAAREAIKKGVPATRDYGTSLDRIDLGAVIIVTRDHQPRHVVLDASADGEYVYC